MNLSNRQIKRGFWYFRPLWRFPPENITRIDEYRGGAKLSIACTQLNVSSNDQKNIVRQWCVRLPELSKVKYLWFNSRVNQELFDAACEMPGLEGLYIKWSGIKSIDSLRLCSSLKYLHIGSSAQVENADILSEMTKLIVLELEDIKKMQDLSPIRQLNRLEGLAVEGSMQATHVVDSLEPIAELTGLKYLFLTNLKTKDDTLLPLQSLNTLVNLQTAWWWADEEFKILKDSLPNLKYGNPLQQRPLSL
jgi:hypothetical protein